MAVLQTLQKGEPIPQSIVWMKVTTRTGRILGILRVNVDHHGGVRWVRNRRIQQYATVSTVLSANTTRASDIRFLRSGKLPSVLPQISGPGLEFTVEPG